MAKMNHELAATVGTDEDHGDGSEAYDAEHGEYEAHEPAIKEVPQNHQIPAPFTVR